jgi:hypothetical protein
MAKHAVLVGAALAEAGPDDHRQGADVGLRAAVGLDRVGQDVGRAGATMPNCSEREVR